MIKLRGLILDFDGVILDTELPDFASWCRIYESYGCVLDPVTWSSAIGTRDGLDPYALLEELTGRTLDRDVIRAKRRPFYAELVSSMPTMDGVEQCLREASLLGLKLGVASSSDEPWVCGHLERLNLLHYFGAVKCGGSSLRGKPAPDTYAAALDELGLAAAEVLSIEDSPNGIAAAKAAGLCCIAVPNPMTAPLDLTAADAIVSSLAAISLARIGEDWPELAL